MDKRYILLSAAKNEEDHIERTIESILCQTTRPIAWFIADDGSTDKTAEIVARAAARNPFIQARSSGRNGRRSFGSKDKAINAAFEEARKLSFDFVGVLDADIELGRADYYDSMMRRFHANPKLGIAGGYIYERLGGEWRSRRCNSADSVAGGIQLFRRACYEKIGGFRPLHYGGEDWLAQLDARIAGWEVLASPEFPVRHYRPTSSANGRWRGLFRLGMMDASFGSHPVFELLKCCRRVVERPVLVGGAVRFFGYFWWKASGRGPLLAAEQVTFLRREQTGKVVQLLRVFAMKSGMQSKQLSF